MNNNVCLWFCAILGEIVELFFQKILTENFGETGNSIDDQKGTIQKRLYSFALDSVHVKFDV